MTSKALFMRVAESMVIFWPIDHVGCFRACSGVTASISSNGLVRKGPPEPVIIRRLIGLSSPRRHCQMALGSLSTGSTAPPYSASNSLIISPAITIGSLLESATSLPCFRALSVGIRPTLPMVAIITVSTSSRHTMSSMGVRDTPSGHCAGGFRHQACWG